ncbi:MAG: hypothetical protein IPH65_11785 [Dehalococcoidia bacterium]|uniref:hypothetical protein n=1 Tax=Candidatus Amarobacter glycogenicus TaxID=3140699 RepID=UPI003135FF7D|nr:hypothetical protein [Dehalococcoidia bacterium]
MLDLAHVTQAMLVDEAFQHFELAQRRSGADDDRAENVLHVRRELRHEHLRQETRAYPVQRVRCPRDHAQLVRLPLLEVAEAEVLHLLHRLFAAEDIDIHADLLRPAAADPELLFAEEDPADRLVLGFDVVTEAERHGKHALAFVMVHLGEREVAGRPLPEDVHGADAVPERGDEHLLGAHEVAFLSIVTRSMSFATWITPL